MRTSPSPGRLVEVGGHRLHLDCRGTGAPPVVFDAALGASSLSWAYVHPAVAAFTTACTYDRAGFGWSDAGPLPRTAGRIVEELHALLAAARVEPPHVLVGHSFGGLVVRLYAARYPSDVGGLVLLDPAYPEDWIEPTPALAALVAKGVRLCRYGEHAARLRIPDLVVLLARLGALRLARSVAVAASRGDLSRTETEVIAPLRKLPPELQALAIRPWTQRRFYQALGSQIEAVGASSAELPRDQSFGDLPMIVVSGARNSDAGQLSRQQRLAARSSRGRHVVAQGSGHWIPLDRPDVVVEAIREVVDDVRASL
ncbi:MAG TPA: alpha/beta hydrolase [Vicinamibacterales bacterium]|nr:alpha/beta hydrolase [Vicinamibacterales bacterium]